MRSIVQVPRIVPNTCPHVSLPVHNIRGYKKLGFGGRLEDGFFCSFE